MSDSRHVDLLRAGPRTWNTWRRKNPDVVPDLNDLKLSISERQFARVQGGPVNLSLAALCRAGLDQATLIEANLTGAVLIDADLSDARLEKADLRGANLCNVRLAYAALNDARLEGAILCGGDLRHARGLTQTQIDQALGDRRTALPANLAMPKRWLQEGHDIGQLVKQTDPQVDDQKANPYAILGIRTGASMRDIRAAWLKLVKELHPDGWSDKSSASERLKAINQAYQRLKNLERHANQRGGARGAFQGARAVFAAFFLVSIAVTALVVAGRTYLAHPDAATHEGPTAAGTNVNESEHRPPTAHQSMSSATSGPPWADEPSVDAAERLRLR